jgi:hypothetical protein
LHTRKGSITDYDGIMMEEGPWPQKAYWDALARARERDAGWYIDYGWTRPKVISQGPIAQGVPANVTDANSLPSATGAEEVPAGEPTPARQPAPAQVSPEVYDIGPLPGVQQETRVQPKRTAARSEVAPVSYVSEPADSRSGNPLRGSNGKPVGTGVE